MGRKIKRTKRLYKRHTANSLAVRTTLFILLIALLVGFGFIISKEWAKRFGKDATQSSAPTVSDISSTPIKDEESQTTSEETSSTAAEVDFGADTNAIHMPFDVLQQQQADGYSSYLNQIKADGFNAVYVELKTQDGMLHYKSTNEMAAKYGAISENAVDINSLTSAIKAAGLKPIAQISALKDAKAAHVSNENSYAYEDQLDVNWLDNSVAKGGKAWLNPYMDNARAYISAIAKEVADAGFDAVVLENVMFPDKNTKKMNLVNRSKDFAAILRQTIDEVQAAVGDKPVYVGYHAQPLVKTKDNPYYVSAAEIAYNKIVVLIDDNDLAAVSLHSTKDAPMTSQQKIDATKKLLDSAKLLVGNENQGDVLAVGVFGQALKQEIDSTIAEYAFGSILQ